MGDVDEGNIQVVDGCRNYNGKLSNNYSYGTFYEYKSNFSLYNLTAVRVAMYSSRTSCIVLLLIHSSNAGDKLWLFTK